MASRAKKTASGKQADASLSEIVERFKAHPFMFGGTIVILVLVVVAFVLVPAMPTGDSQQQGGDLVFGYYNGSPISYMIGNYFARTLQASAQAEKFDLNGDYSLDSETASRVWYQAFIRTMVHTAILDEMKSAGYTAPAAEIDGEVAANFQEDGVFSVTRYRQYGKAQLLSLWRSMEEDFITRKYIDDLAGLRVSEAEKNFIGDMASPERNFELVAFPRSAYPDTEISAFVRANPAPFKMVHLSKITIPSSEKDAQNCLQSVRDGRTFEDAARNQSQDAYSAQGGDMGIKMAYEIYTDLSEEADRDRVLGLAAGELSPVVKVPAGWAFYRAEENSYPVDLASADNLAKLRSYMNRFEGGRVENWLAARAEELMAAALTEGKTLYALVEERAAAGGIEAQFPVRQFGPVNLNYGNVQLFLNSIENSGVPELAGAATNENFWKNAFSGALNSSSTPFTLGDSIVVLTPTSETILDDTNKGYIRDWYAQGWMYNTLDSDLNSVFSASKKFENNFYAVYLGRVLNLGGGD
jgi:hypothetical protein